MNTTEEIMDKIVSPITANMTSLSIANVQLTFALAKHLIEKEVINLDEYLESHEATKEALIKVGGDTEIEEVHISHIKRVFDAHRDELENL